MSHELATLLSPDADDAWLSDGTATEMAALSGSATTGYTATLTVVVSG